MLDVQVQGLFIPVVFAEADIAHIPEVLSGATRYVLDRDYDDLYRQLTDQPAVIPPPIGKRRVLPPVSTSVAEPQGADPPTQMDAPSASPLRLVFEPPTDKPSSYHQVWIGGDQVTEELYRVGVLNAGARDVENVRVLLTDFKPQGSQNLPLPMHVMNDNAPEMPLSREGFRLSVSAEPRRYVDVAFKAYTDRERPGVLLDHIYLQHAEPGIPAAIPDGRYEITLVVEGRDVPESAPFRFVVWVDGEGQLRFAPVGVANDHGMEEPRVGSRTAEDVVGAARDQARKLGHLTVGPAHVLLGLLEVHDPAVGAVLTDFGVTFDRDAIRSDLEGRLTPQEVSASARLRLLPTATALLDAAHTEAHRLGQKSTRAVHLLIATLGMASLAGYVRPSSIAADDVRTIVAQLPAAVDW